MPSYGPEAILIIEPICELSKLTAKALSRSPTTSGVLLFNTTLLAGDAEVTFPYAADELALSSAGVRLDPSVPVVLVQAEIRHSTATIEH